MFGAHTRTAGDVARGDDLRHGRHAARVAPHSVVQAQSGAGQPVGGGAHPDPDDHEVGVQQPPVGEFHRPYPARPVVAQPLHARAAQQPHPVVRVQSRADPRQVRAELGHQRQRRGLHDRHRKSQCGTGGSGFGADEAAADDDHARCSVMEGGPQRAGVVVGAQDVHSCERRARQGARDGSGGDDETVGAQGTGRTAVVEGHRASCGVQRGGPGAEVPLGVQTVLLFPVGQPEFRQPHDVRAPLGEERLGQRRPVVRAVGFGADDHQPSVEPFRAQGPRRVQSCQ